jgi:tetratricopeptide (TPR) repeat protein
LAYANRGWAALQKNELDKAIADFTEVIRLEPNNAAAFNNRGSAWSEKKEHDKAIADFSEAIRLEPRNVSYYDARGMALGSKKEFAKALSDYNEAIGLDPGYARAYNSRAWLWATCPYVNYRDGKKGVESARKACELTEWKNPFHVGTLAAAYAEAGEFEAAVKWQLKANTLYADAKDRKDGEARLKLYQDKKPYREIVP